MRIIILTLIWPYQSDETGRYSVVYGTSSLAHGIMSFGMHNLSYNIIYQYVIIIMSYTPHNNKLYITYNLLQYHRRM